MSGFYPNFFRRIALSACILFLGVSCSSEKKQPEIPKNPADFNAENIIAERKEKDEYFKSEKSPLPPEERGNFTALNYFPPSEQYRVTAQFLASEKPDTVLIQATKANDTRKMLRIGTLKFTIESVACSLSVFKNADKRNQDYLFVPFKDATTGGETYGAGRYLDLTEKSGAKEYIVDFNLAYNPYCAYSERFSCPLVPQENTLSAAIRAGEKSYGGH